MKIRSLAAYILIGMVLGACSTKPQYTTRYTLTPPASAQGRTCVATCQGNKQLCAINVRGEKQQCRADKKSQAQDCKRRAGDSYRNCLNRTPPGTSASSRSLQRTHRSYCRTKRDTDRNNCGYRSSSCRPSTDCDRDYRGCFKQCGGKVHARSVCYRNCENIKK